MEAVLKPAPPVGIVCPHPLKFDPTPMQHPSYRLVDGVWIYYHGDKCNKPEPWRWSAHLRRCGECDRWISNPWVPVCGDCWVDLGMNIDRYPSWGSVIELDRQMKRGNGNG